MQRLFAQLQRLFLLPAAPAWTAESLQQAVACGDAGLTLSADAAGSTRTLVIGFSRARDWDSAAALLATLTDTLGLRRPALAIDGVCGYQLWLSLAAPIPVAEAQAWWQALKAQYLSELPDTALMFFPGEGSLAAISAVPVIPARIGAAERWSAFIDPNLGGLFRDEPWLEMPPGDEAQADLLAGCTAISAAEFAHSQAALQTATAATAAKVAAAADAAALAAQREAEKPLQQVAAYADPKDFLLALMNDGNARPEIRVEAAKALLPYFHRPKTSPGETP